MGTVQGSVEEGLEGMVQQGEDKGSGPFVENTRTRCLSFQNENFLGISGCLPTQGKQEFYHKVPATRRGVRNKFCLLEWHGNSPRSCKKWTLATAGLFYTVGARPAEHIPTSHYCCSPCKAQQNAFVSTGRFAGVVSWRVIITWWWTLFAEAPH